MGSDPNEQSDGTRQVVRLGVASLALETVLQLVRNNDLRGAQEEITRLIAARHADMGRAFQKAKTTVSSRTLRPAEVDRIARQKIVESYYRLLIGLLRYNAPALFMHVLQELAQSPPCKQSGKSCIAVSPDNALFYLSALLLAYASDGKKSVADCFPSLQGKLENDPFVHQRSYARSFYKALVSATESGDLGHGKIGAMRWGSDEPIKTVEPEIVVTLRFAGPARETVQQIIERFGKARSPEEALTAFILWAGATILKRKE